MMTTRTPPCTSISVQVHETPAMACCNSRWKYLTGQLDLLWLWKIFVLSLWYPSNFCSTMSYPLPTILELPKLQAKLGSESVIRENGWLSFKPPPKGSRQQEDVVFKPLIKVFDAILKLVKRVNKTLFPVLKCVIPPIWLLSPNEQTAQGQTDSWNCWSGRASALKLGGLIGKISQWRWSSRNLIPTRTNVMSVSFCLSRSVVPISL